MTADHRSRRRSKDSKAAWLTGGLLFLIASGLLGIFSGGDSISSRPHLAQVAVEGPIMNAEPTVSLLEKAREASHIRGVLLRVNSPGGSVGASEAIYQAVARLSEKKPVAVSMGGLAASGGYMVALGGDRIFALDSTLTGSIGVIMMSTGVFPLLDKIGVVPRIIKSGRFKDAGSPLREMSEADRAYLQSMVDELHKQFVQLVAKERGMDVQEARPLANGRVFSGQQAQSEGLIDALGGEQTAEAWLRAQAELGPDAPLEELQPPEDWIQELMPAGLIGWLQMRLSPEPRYLYMGG
ncbi:signal peptide peptidase SppA [Thiohalorhabdus methylotrophus]|uniref:Signal peptide peptidase SppA n=1 Tax=Thiohalorhabdus methylotrophus TaxID=3242694 RepID=A0ABV4U0M8_9GAMM